MTQLNNMTYFFLDKSTGFARQQFYDCPTSQELLYQPQFSQIADLPGVQVLIAPDQVHGTDGIVIQDLEAALHYKPYSQQADFVVTNVPGVALGVATADCLPMIFYDSCEQVIAVAHAGWQGTVQGIAIKTVQAMEHHFGCQPSNITVLFGPCASVENYEVREDFIAKLREAPCANDSNPHDVVISKNGRLYFDMTGYNRQLLEAVGVKNSRYEYNRCTIADHAFCSYRREKDDALRQMSIAVLFTK